MGDIARKHVIVSLVMALAMGYVLGADAVEGDKRLIGSWRLIEVEQQRKRHVVKESEQEIWVIRRDEIISTVGRDELRASYHVSEGKDPKGIEMRCAGKFEKYVIRGIYRVRDDRLELCTCKDVDAVDVFVGAPRDFVTDEKDGRVVLSVFERVTQDERR